MSYSVSVEDESIIKDELYFANLFLLEMFDPIIILGLELLTEHCDAGNCYIISVIFGDLRTRDSVPWFPTW